MATQAQAVTDREITAAMKRYPNIEVAFKLNLGLTMEQDEALDERANNVLGGGR